MPWGVKINVSVGIVRVSQKGKHTLARSSIEQQKA